MAGSRIRSRQRGHCSARGDWGAQCTEVAGHRYAHYDASEDVSWTDRTEDHRDGCTCDCCEPDLCETSPPPDSRP